MKNILFSLSFIKSILLSCTSCSTIKKAELEWSLIVKVILALLLFVIFATIIATGQTNVNDSVCGGIAEQFKSYIYEQIHVAGTTKAC